MYKEVLPATYPVLILATGLLLLWSVKIFICEGPGMIEVRKQACESRGGTFYKRQMETLLRPTSYDCHKVPPQSKWAVYTKVQ